MSRVSGGTLAQGMCWDAGGEDERHPTDGRCLPEGHPPYKALVERIEATDDLIDQIGYRLYGLTEEEIAVVEED